MSSSAPRLSPIAIIGMGCRFPKAPNVAAYWQLLVDGVDAITKVPASRWDVDDFYDPRPATPCKTNTRAGGFLDNIDQFDPYFFGISPREAIRLDPQQRLLLETTWEAMEHAGIPRQRFNNSRTAVFMGVCSDDYVTLERSDLRNVDIYMGTGGSRDSIAGRIAFVYGLTGPVAAIDSACSSSLVAVHQACTSLQMGDCDMALAGGVNVVLHPGTAVAFSQANLLSPDSRCKAFDARANGFVRSEGAGVVLLKPLDRAIADGDPIYAVIKGTASNNDGCTSPFMTPSKVGQTELLRQVYDGARIDARTIQYVEAHGTGTAVGDPIEIGALSTVFANRAPDDKCILGSSKTNIGHLEAAAGVAGLIKTVLCLQHKTIPRNLHFETPNPAIPWDDVPFTVPTATTPWPSSIGPSRAGVNSFGISGTNAHVIVEEAPAKPSAAPHHGAANTSTAATLSPLVLLLSGHTPGVLQHTLSSYRDLIATAEPDGVNIADLCWSAATRRTHHEFRAGIVASSLNELRDKIEGVLRNEDVGGVVQAAASADFDQSPVFVFSGIGTQWAGMGTKLYATEPVFRDMLVQCDAVIQSLNGWSLIDELHRNKADSRLDRVDIMQPAIFAVQVALAALWKSRGVQPSAVVGHSLGEIAASYVAGAITLHEAARIACARSRLMSEVGRRGRMAAVGLAPEQLQERISHFGAQVCIAVVNGPTACTISGDADAVSHVVQALDAEGVFCRMLAIDVACHSDHMDSLVDRLRAALVTLEPRDTTIPLYSSLRGAMIEGTSVDADYWVDNLRNSVRFDLAMSQLLHEGHRVFLEVSPNPALLTPVRQNASRAQVSALALPSLRANTSEHESLLEALASLFANGVRVNYTAAFPTGQFVPPPTYTWQRERFWFDESTGLGAWMNRAASGLSTSTTHHPLLGTHVHGADASGTHYFQAVLDLNTSPWWADHRVEGMPLFPAAGYVELAIAAAAELHGMKPRIVHDVQLRKALFLSKDTPTEIQLVISGDQKHARRIETVATVDGSATLTFHCYGRDVRGASDTDEHAHSESDWRLLASGRIDDLTDHDPSRRAKTFSRTALHDGLFEYESGDQFYSNEFTGFSFDGAFRGVHEAWGEKHHAVTRLQLPQFALTDAKRFRMHPALLDAVFHSLLAATDADPKLSLPQTIDAIEIFSIPESTATLWCESHSRELEDGYSVEMGLYGDDGTCHLFASGYRTKFVESPSGNDSNPADWLYETRWTEAPRRPGIPNGVWLIVGEGASAEGIAATLRAAGVQAEQLVETHDHVALQAGVTTFAQLANVQGVVYAAAPDHVSDAEIPATAARITKAFFDLLQIVASTSWGMIPRLFVVTQDAKSVGDTADSHAGIDSAIGLAQAPLAGLARVAAIELREFHVTQIDVARDGSPADLLNELLGADQETEIALRDGIRLAARLSRLDTTPPVHTRRVRISDDGAASYRLESAGGGVFEDLKLHATERQAPAANEVEVRVGAVGLNFLDVLKALNLAPGLPEGARFFGMECAGRIVAVGANVTDIQVGDEVVVMDSTATGCFRAFLTTAAAFVLPKPAHLTLAEAVTIPVAYQTAWYALSDLARLRKGESVLIHSAAGGVGLAALEIARQRGAIVYATAGTEEKRDLLRAMGVPYVMNSRTLDFAKDVMTHSNGRGVDVVLNSLAGEAIPQSLALLATGGRFVEIGKRDIYADSQLGLLPFQRNLSFFAVDLLRMRLEKPEVVEELTREVAQHLWNGTFKPLPHTAFPISETSDAFRYMAKGTHVGKIVITLDADEVDVIERAPEIRVRNDGTYIVTGGLGGLGLEFAKYLAAQGARHITLFGRNAPSSHAQSAIEQLQSTGTNIVVERCDVGDARPLEQTLTRIRQRGVPIRGVLHAAGITDDRTLRQLSWSNFESVFAAKVSGAHNLHAQLHDDTLDFVVLFSSAASVMGGAGQANYAAANAFLDAFAHYQCAHNHNTVSINWGPWADVGMAAIDDNRGARMADRGLLSIPVKQGTELLGTLLQQPKAQIAVMPIDWARWAESFPEAVGIPFLENMRAELGGQRSAETSGIRAQVLSAGSRESALSMVVTYLQGEAARILRVPVDRLNPGLSLTRFGLDSLMAVELKNRIEADLAINLSTARLLQGPTANELASWLVAELPANAAESSTVSASAPVAASGAESAVDVAALSDDEVAAMLNAMLHESGHR